MPRTLACLLALSLLVPPAEAGRKAPEPPTRWTLANGVPITWLPGDDPPTLVLRIAAGRRDSPEGLAGLADVTARSLTAGTLSRMLPDETLQALAEVATDAHVTVTPGATWLVLEALQDPGAGLALAAEMLTVPVFPPLGVDESKAALCSEILAAHEDPRRPLDSALADLPGSPAPATCWSVHSIEREDAARFHARHYVPSALRVGVAGSWPDGLEGLKAALDRQLATWITPTPEAEPAAPMQSQPQRHARLLRTDGKPGLSFAMPVPAAGAPAALLALRAAVEHRWAVSGGALTLAGDLVAPSGGGLVVDAAGADPVEAAESIRRRLDRLANKGPGKRHVDRWRRKLVAELSEEAGVEAFLETDGLADAESESVSDRAERLLADLDAEAVQEAARQLLAGSRALVATLPADKPGSSWHRAFPTTDEHASDEVDDPAERQARVEGRAAWDALVEKHGGDVLQQLSHWTAFTTKYLVVGGERREIGDVRFDADLSQRQLRTEIRRGKSPAGVHLTILNGEEGSVHTMRGRTDLAADGVSVLRSDFRHQPLQVLRRSPVVARSVPAKEGEGAAIELLDARDGITRIGTDPLDGLLKTVSYRYRLPEDVPRLVTLTLSEYRRVAGAVLPFRHERTSVGNEDADGSIDFVEGWQFHGPAFKPLTIFTAPDDIHRIVSGGT
jgi:hypothetical protein